MVFNVKVIPSHTISFVSKKEEISGIDENVAKRTSVSNKGGSTSGCNFYSLEDETLELVLMLIKQRANVGITHHLHGDVLPGDHGCVGATQGEDHCICQNKVTMTEIPEINSIYTKSFI